MIRNTLTQTLTEDRVKTQGKDGLVTRIMHLQTEQVETRRGKEGQPNNQKPEEVRKALDTECLCLPQIHILKAIYKCEVVWR